MWCSGIDVGITRGHELSKMKRGQVEWTYVDCFAVYRHDEVPKIAQMRELGTLLAIASIFGLPMPREEYVLDRQCES